MRLIAFIMGLLFSIGLAVSQMVNPDKVLNFLDIMGNWDGSLFFVIVGALLVFGGGYFIIIRRRNRCLLGEKFALPTNKQIDLRLVIGAAIFGVGWGIAGICPGPAIANLLSGEVKIIGFLVMMVLGMWCAGRTFLSK